MAWDILRRLAFYDQRRLSGVSRGLGNLPNTGLALTSTCLGIFLRDIGLETKSSIWEKPPDVVTLRVKSAIENEGR